MGLDIAPYRGEIEFSHGRNVAIRAGWGEVLFGKGKPSLMTPTTGTAVKLYLFDRSASAGFDPYLLRMGCRHSANR
jgi:hypothetical protein